MAINRKATRSRGDIMKRLDDLEDEVSRLQTGRRLEQSSVREQGLRVHEGGGIRLQDGGNLRVEDGGDILVTDGGDIRVEGGKLEAVDTDGNQVFLIDTDPLDIFLDPALVSELIPVGPGRIEMFAGPLGEIPDGWLHANGQAISRTGFPGLFDAIGTTWGSGDGSTTFNVPDLRGRVLVGAGSGGFSLGDTGGSQTHDHTNPSTGSAGSHSHSNPSTGSAGTHDHDIILTNEVRADGAFAANVQTSTQDAGSHSHSVGSTGSDGSHTHSQGDTGSSNHMPPHAALIPIIRT